MAKKSDIPIGVADINEFLATQDDFALELAIYHQAKLLGLEVTHGGNYEDPLTKKPRQYDLRVFRILGDQRIDLAIECKSLSPSFPLLISRIRRIPEESYHEVIWSYNDDGTSSRFRIPGLDTNARTARLRNRDSVYPEGEFVGKATTQIGRNDKGQFLSGDGQVFDKWSQALASAADLVFDATDHYEDSENGICNSFICPVVVVPDGTLWVVDYEDDGAVRGDPVQTDEATLFVGREYWGVVNHPGYAISHLHFCTRSGVVALLSQVADDPRLWERLFPVGAILASVAGD